VRSLTNQDLTRHLDASHWIDSPEGENSNGGTPIVVGVVQPARLEVAAREVATFEDVSYLVMISGAFDLLVEVLCQDTDTWPNSSAINSSAWKGCSERRLFYILRTYKLSYRWGMSPEDEAALLSGETTYKDVRQNPA
jgi:hypothetical protein